MLLNCVYQTLKINLERSQKQRYNENMEFKGTLKNESLEIIISTRIIAFYTEIIIDYDDT